MKHARLIWLLLLTAIPAIAQSTSGAGFPSVTCSATYLNHTYIDTTNQLSYQCVNVDGTGYLWRMLGGSPVLPVASAPTGACTAGIPDQQVVTTGVLYSCQAGTWGPVGGGTGGAVSGQANGVIPLATAATTIGAQSHLSDNGSAVSSSLPFAFQDTSTQVSAAYRTPGITVSPLCPTGSTTCVKINGDTQYEVDCTSNSTTTMVCPSGNFTNADVGKVAWATTQGSGAGVGYLLYTTFVCPQTTIASVTNSTTVVLNNACTASGSGNVVFIWGHDDGPTLRTSAASWGCNVVHVSTAGTFIMTSEPFLNVQTCGQQLRTSVGAPGAALVGDGFNGSQTVFVLTPNFSWGDCSDSGVFCFTSMARVIANLQFWGTGLTSAANSNCANGANKVVVSAYGPSSEMSGVDVAGICPGTSGMTGIQLNSTDEILSFGGAQEVGTIACGAVSSKAMHSQANDCLNTNVSGGYGFAVTNGAQVLSYGNTPMVGVTVDGTSQLTSIKTVYQAGSGVPSLTTVSGSRVISQDDQFTTMTHAGTLYTQNSTYTGAITNTGAIISQGGNKITALPTTSGAGTWTGTGVLFGSCTGTATSSATLGLYGLGQFANPACASTVVNLGVATQAVPISGSVFNLACTATHAGVNASSGVVTVLKNNVATALTCTIGTGTSCFDNAHFDVPAVGDVYSIKFTTQTSEVLAGVSCTVLNW